MRWSSGALVTNRDVLFGWRIGMDPKDGPYCLGTCDHITSIDLRGRYTVVLHLRVQWGPLLRTGLPPVIPHAWSALGGTARTAVQVLADDPDLNYQNGSYWTDGPYQVTSYQKDDHITFSRMKYFHLGAAPHITTVIFRFYQNKPALTAAVATGAVDVSGGYFAGDLKNLESQGLIAQLRLRPSLLLDHVEFNVLNKKFNGQPNPLLSKRVRQALALVVNRTGMMRTALGLSASATAPFAARGLLPEPFQLPPAGPRSANGNWDPLRSRFVSNPAMQVEDARKLLAQAGWPEGFMLDLHVWAQHFVPLRDKELESLTASWASIRVAIHVVDMPPCFGLALCEDESDLYSGHFQAALLGAYGGPDPASIVRFVGSSFVDRKADNHDLENLNFSGIQDAIIDSAVRAGNHTEDESKRAPAYLRLQNRVVKQAYWIPLFFRPSVATANADVRGFTGHPDPESLLWNVPSWRKVKG
jgi:ABC-type transport system substrate-binding protein